MQRMAVFVVLICGLTKIANAQTNLDDVNKSSVFEAIPSDPVFELLGLNSGQISQPGSVKDLLSSIATARDHDGRLVPGYGLTFAPYQMLNPDLPFIQYVNNWCTRFCSNWQLSLGTAPSVRQDSSLDVGIGTRFVFFNSGDGRLDKTHIDSLVAESNPLLSPLPQVGQKWTAGQREAADSEFLQRVRESNGMGKLTAASKWNNTFLQLDAGVVMRASNSYLSKSALDHLQAWINGGIGGGIWQLIGQVGFTMRNTQMAFYGPDSASSFVGAIEARIGNPDFRAGLGANTVEFNQGNLALSAELRLSNGLWGVYSLTRAWIKDQPPGLWVSNFTLKTTI